MSALWTTLGITAMIVAVPVGAIIAAIRHNRSEWSYNHRQWWSDQKN